MRKAKRTLPGGDQGERTKKRELHQSDVKLYLKCGELYRLLRIERVQVPSRSYLTVGSAVDAAVNRAMLAKISKKGMGESEMADACATEFDRLAPETEWEPEEDKDWEKDSAISCVKLYHRQVLPKIDPLTVQEHFIIETDDFNLRGTFDIIEKNGMIRDTKTAGKMSTPSAPARDIQGASYDFAYQALYEEPATGWTLDRIIKRTKTKPPRYEPVKAKIRQHDRRWVFGAITKVLHAMDAGVFLPAAETAWWCSPKCPVWNECKGKKQ